MKVICINDQWRIPPSHGNYPTPPFMSEHIVVDELVIGSGKYADDLPVLEGTYYQLSDPYSKFYHSSKFAILPGADAEQIDQESKEAIVNIEQPVNAF